jgi:uncharacterized membrane protein
MMTIAFLTIAFAFHHLGAVVWVGGMFGAYVCLRPAARELEAPQRLRLWRQYLQKFFPWMWASVLAQLLSGYWLLFTMYGSFAAAPLYINLMQAIGWVMIVFFVWLFYGPWLAFKRAADTQDLQAAAAHLNRIRQIVLVNLPLGLIVVVIAGTGPFW